MKSSFVLFIWILILSVSLVAQEIPSDSLYLGQIPPSGNPVIFNLPVTSGFRPCERVAITSNGKEIYYAEINTYPPSSLRIKRFIYQNNHWQGPTNVFEGFMAPKLSPDDSIMYLQDNAFHTYYSKRMGESWSTPIRMISQNLRTHYFQKTELNNYYISTYYEGSTSNGEICQLVMQNGDTLCKSFGKPLNTSFQENDFFIAPDESYIIVSRNASGNSADMYLSFKKENGNWTNPKKFDARINADGYNWEYGQFISKDGKYLFYTSGGLDWSSYYTYWIKIDQIIDSMRNTNYAPYLNNQIATQTDSVGYEFSYTVPDTTFYDDDGNSTLIYSATLSNGSPLPSWLTFDSATNTFIGTPTSAGNYLIKVIATDNANAKAFCTFNLKIENSVTSVNDYNQSLNNFKLNQNFPNPFNPTTKISWQSNESTWQTVKVFDVLGKEVATLVDEYKPAGNYEVEFDASNISSGIYFYVLKTSTFCSQKKMIALK